MDDLAIEAIAARRDFTFGEVAVAFRDGQVELSGPHPGPDAHELEGTVEALREHVRSDAHGRYRPLSGARTMPRNWRVSLPENLAEAAIDAVYPQALLHQGQAAQGLLHVVPLDAVVARQRGRYRIAGELDAEGQERARDALCGRCVRTPVWAGKAASDEEIPCPEPCSVMIALCREAALWQREAPQPSSPDPEVAFADFPTRGNEVREAYLARTPAGVSRG
ncbi:MAG: DR2241 family protein [Chloroflexi bacterium]|nr:DR2241 family protein [Chloroflexota bacterium]